jgi:glutamate racemase
MSAVGVFDSGVGGLTVVGAIHRRLPRENIVYLGDTARVPYGNKSPETIVRYARQDTQFLLGHGVKAVVVACNTATAHALEALQEQFPVPVLGVIEPGVEAALAATKTGRIGIIGTVGTIQSGAYQRALLARNPKLDIVARATPLLVPLIEEDWLDHDATRLVLADYLAPFRRAEIDTLVLACTHYPLLKNLLRSVLGEAVALVDSAENMACTLERILKNGGLEAASNGKPDTATGKISVYVSDLPVQFDPLARRFLGKAVGTVEKAALE